MGCSVIKALGMVAMIHVLLGVLSVVFGIVALKVAPHYSNGVFGMGIWLGGWMLITGVAGLLSAHNPKNFCKLGGFIGCCLVGMVTMAVCSVILGVGVIKHFAFESTVTREYYKEYDYAKYTHEDYYKPQEYFDERNRKGHIGCGIYGSLLSIIILDVLMSFASCFIGRAIINREHLNITSSQRGRRRQRQIPESAINRGRVVVINQTAAVVHVNGLQGNFLTTPGYPGPKLPNYLDIYPEGSPTWQTSGTDVVDPASLVEPPPEYTETPNPTESTVPEENQTTSPTGQVVLQL